MSPYYYILLSTLTQIPVLIVGFCVNAIASFTAAVLSHPLVRDAFAETMKEGMTRFLTQPNLDEHLKVMSDTLAKNQSEAARNAGEEFPRLVGSFLQGMMSPRKIPSDRPNTHTDVPPSEETKERFETTFTKNLEQTFSPLRKRLNSNKGE